MANYFQRFEKELSDPMSLTISALKLTNDLMLDSNRNNEINREIHSDMQKAYNTMNHMDSCSLKDMNIYLTQKYKSIIENSNSELILIEGETLDKLTDLDHLCAITKIIEKLAQVIHMNNHNKNNKVHNLVSKHILFSAIKAIKE